MEYASLSVDEIKQQLDEIEQSKAELQRALFSRRQEARAGVVSQIREIIAKNGYEIDEVVQLLQQRRGRRGAVAASPVTGSRDYTRYVDPENPANVYVRGVLPGWMKQKMQEQGYDPSVKADREAFKKNYLQSVEA